MTDIRLTKKAQSADISTASITTNVNVPSLVVTIPDVANPGLTIQTDIGVNVELAGYGEESISQPGLIKYLQDLAVSIDHQTIKNINKSLVDNFTSSEILSKHITTAKLDTAAIADAFSRVVYYIRSFEDVIDATDDFYGVANIDDDQTAYFQKRVNETSVVIEEIKIDSAKLFNDSFTNSEIIDKIASLLKSETTNTLETINKSMSKVLSDTFERADTISKLLNKPLSDLFGYSEIYNLLIGKNIVEVILTAEAIDISSTKILSDTTLNSEVINKSSGKINLDSVSNTDQNILLFNKAANESTSTSELFTISANQNSSDVISISELFSRVFTIIRDFVESSYISEVFAKSLFKVIDELISVVDLVSRVVNLNKVETLSTTEVISTVTDKVLTDLISATDDFYGLANVDDDQTARIDKVVVDSGILTELFSSVTTFIRSFTDVASISDEFRKSTSKIFSDQINRSDIVTQLYEKVSIETVSSSQTLSINIQSYFQSDYVTVGYTGQNYTY